MNNRKRNRWPLYLTVGIMLASCGGAHAGSYFLTNPSGLSNVAQGSAFNMDVVLQSYETDIFAFDFEVTFPSFLNVLGVTESGYFGANGVLGLSPTIDNTNGVISGLYDAAAAPNNVVGDGLTQDSIVSIVFFAVATGSGSVNIECDNGNDCANYPMLSDGSFNPLGVDFILPGSVTVVPADSGGGPPPPQQGDVPEPASALLTLPALAGWIAYRRKAQRVVDGPTRG